MIRITSKKDGFRRAGMPHRGTKEYPDDYFTEEQLAALQAEPMLFVECLPDDADPPLPLSVPPTEEPEEAVEETPQGEAAPEAEKQPKSGKGKK